MLYTPHAITGATIAYFVPNPVIAIILSLISHLFFDVFPHSNPNPIKAKGVQNIIILAEIIIGNVVLFFYSYLLSGKFENSNYALTVMIICGITANLPDILTGPYAMFRKNWFYSESIAKFQGLIQNHVKGSIGYTLQVLFMFVLVYIAFFIS